MAERALLRIGSVAAVLGAVLGVIVNLLHPRYPEIGQTEPYLRAVAGSRLWVGDHIGILFAVLLLTGGLIALARSITVEPAAAWARLAQAATLVSFPLLGALVATDGPAAKKIAGSWAAAEGADKAMALRAGDVLAQISTGLFVIWVIVFFGVTFVLHGLAVARSGLYPGWLGWLAVLVGLGSAWVGLVQAYRGPSVLYFNVLFVVFSVAATVWVFVMGLLLWRRAA